jgi:hypothetical protein
VHWVIKVVEAMVGAAERRAYTQHERNIARKTTQIERVSGRFLICSMKMRERQKQYRDRMRESSV